MPEMQRDQCMPAARAAIVQGTTWKPSTFLVVRAASCPTLECVAADSDVNEGCRRGRSDLTCKTQRCLVGGQGPLQEQQPVA